MAAPAAGKLVSALCTLSGASNRLRLGYTPACTILQTRDYAARKGTRAKANKKKVKRVVQKVEFIPHNQREMSKTIISLKDLVKDDTFKKVPTDDVWIGKYYKWKVYSFEEAVQCHKECNQLGMLDAPDAFIKAHIELDMKGIKPSKPVSQFARIVAVPHQFNHGELRNVAAFCKSPEMQKEALDAGADIAGGPELVYKVQTGDVSLNDYNYVVAHPDMLAELVVIKGLLKRKYPQASHGTLHGDVVGMVRKFVWGIQYSGKPHHQQPLYGIAEANFGRVNMDTKQLEENFVALINDMNVYRPKRPGPFITRIRLLSPPSKEMLKVDHELYVNDKKVPVEEDDEAEDEPYVEAI